MPHSTTPHTESQQNAPIGQSDMDAPDATQPDGNSPEYANAAGAQTGTNRAPESGVTAGRGRNTEPQQAAHEGNLTTRTPQSDQQGITTHSATDESARQEKVVKDRPDAQAGVNQAK